MSPNGPWPGVSETTPGASGQFVMKFSGAASVSLTNPGSFLADNGGEVSAFVGTLEDQKPQHYPMPACTLLELRVYKLINNVESSNPTVTVVVNGVDSALTLTMPGSDPVGTKYVVTGTVVIAAGDDIDVHLLPSSSEDGGNVAVSATVTGEF